MIQKVMFVNPINNLEKTFRIHVEFDTVEEWLNEANKKDDVMDYYLDCLDCTKLINGKPIILPDYFAYDHYSSLFIFHLNKITDAKKYNTYLDRFIKLHCNNIMFDYEYHLMAPPKRESKKLSRRKVRNEYVRYDSKDLFTGDKVYTYVNHHTNDEFVSSNPNLLSELNAPKPKKKVKHNNTIMNISFNFNKK